jgi:GH35 family endo-1,4-beta-xylanase
MFIPMKIFLFRSFSHTGGVAFPCLLALLLTCFGAFPAHAESVLPEGAWKITRKSADQLTTKMVRADSQPGGNSEALQVTIQTAVDPFYALALEKAIPTAIKAGIKVRLRFWARSETKNPVRVVVESSGAPYTRIAEISPILSPLWQQFQAVGTTETLFAPGQVSVRLQVGHQAGVIEFAGVTLDTLGPDYGLINARTAIQPTAIKARIDAIRRGDMTVIVKDASGKPRPDVTVTVRQTTSAFLFGCNLFGLNPAGTDAAQLAYQKQFTDLFNYATLPFYWGAFEAAPDKPDNAKLMAMADWGVSHGLTLKGHPLVWHEVYPSWAPTTSEETIPLLENRVFDLIPRYRGKVRIWDVVNEATVSRNASNGIGNWAKRNGPVAVTQQSLRWARAASRKFEKIDKPLFLYNDFNLGPDLTDLLATLRERGELPDAIGIQSHMHDGVWPLEKVWQAAEEYGKFNRPLHFTEVTVVSGARPVREEKGSDGDATNWLTTPEGEKAQGDYLAQFYAVLFSNPKVDAITYWDFSDYGAWQGAPAGLIRTDMTPKPAYDRLKKLIRSEWRTNTTGKSNAQGIYKTRAFYGDYEVTVTDKAGHKIVKTVRFPVGENITIPVAF